MQITIIFFFYFLDSEDSEPSRDINVNRDSGSVSDLGSKKDLGIQTIPGVNLENGSTYVVDRVLTPSIFRVRAKTGGHGREFGTQTDIHYGKYSGDDGDTTERFVEIIYTARSLL